MLSPDARIDTHTHSNVSDGTGSPSHVMAEAREAGIGAIGLVDHDTIAGWNEAEEAVASTGVALIRGMEVSTEHRGATVHMLAYLFDPAHEVVERHTRVTIANRRSRIEEMVDMLSKDYPVSLEDVLAQSAGVSIGRPHVADALVAAGIVADRSEAFATVLRRGSKYYVPRKDVSSLEAIDWIVKAGGKAVFAHPLAVSRGAVVDRHAFDELAEAGLFGIEVWHRDNPESERPFLLETAKRLGLRTFGSSDYHGTGKPNRLGENTTGPETVEALADGAAIGIVEP